ncbi:MAG TPA: hypothetical protein VFX98_12715 [Longimicrobiaceae bacterium]|nr:hypothetical protein [Longimicrobiaceae bacterium]
MKESEIHLRYGDHDPELAREQRVGDPAGIYLLEDRYFVAVFGTRAEERLLERGALLVASLVWDPEEAERSVAGGSPSPLPAWRTRLVPLDPVRVRN